MDGKAREDPNIAPLRASLLDTLNQLDDPKVIAKARALFAAYLTNPNSLSADLRTSVLEIVAAHADTKIWDHLHSLATHAESSLEKRQSYVLLGSAHDRVLAQRALALAQTDEAPITMRPAIIAAVSEYYPDLAFDFAASHADWLNTMLEPDSRNEFAPELASPSTDPAMLAKLDAYAAAHIPATALQATVKAKATIVYSAMACAKRLPEIDRWLKSHRH